MRVLHVSNHSAPRCGVQFFGQQCSAALRAEGVDVVDWDGYYPAVHAREEQRQPSYLPDDLFSYDVIHFNWQPGTLGHYLPDMLPPGLPYSVFLHDLPPWSTCLILDRMRTVFALEDFPGAVEIPPPAPDYRPAVQRAPEVTIGRSNIRDAGREELAAICARHGWVLNDVSPTWLTEAEEVDRLARSWVNVVWYTENRSRGSAAMMCAAAGRPLLLNEESTRFGHLRRFPELYFRPLHALETALLDLVSAVSADVAQHPTAVADAHSWRCAARTMITAWER